MIGGWIKGFLNPGRSGSDASPPNLEDKFAHAAALHQQGRLAEARAAYEEILRVEAAHFDALHLLGVIHYQQGEFDAALRSLQQAIEVNPHQAPAHSNLGLALQRLGRPADAIASYERALSLQPDFPDALFNRGNAYRELLAFDEALRSYDRAIALRPAHAASFNNRGLTLLTLGQPEKALESFAEALRINPSFTDAIANQGAALLALDRYEDARTVLARVIEAKPDHAEALNNLGAALARLGRHGEALESYERAIACVPRFAEAQYNRAALLSERMDYKAAIEGYDRALAIKPDYPEALNGRGTAFRGLGKLTDALSDYDRALALRTAFPEALDNRGVVLALLARHDEALDSHERALLLNPRMPEALANRASVLRETGDLSAAVEGFRRAIDADPASLAHRFRLMVAHIPILASTEEEVDRSRSRFSAEIAQVDEWCDANETAGEDLAIGAMQPFHLAYQEKNNRALLAQYGALCCKLMSRWQSRNPAMAAEIQHSPRQRRRIAIISAHIHQHSVWSAIVKGWIQRLDRTKFELCVVHLGSITDQETEFARANADHFFDGGGTLEARASEIRKLDADALIYPEIGMDTTTPRLAAMRLAAVQVAAWGHPETTGLPAIDYYLSAEGFETRDSPSAYSEKLVALPNLGCFYSADASEPVNVAFKDLRPLGNEPVFVCPGTPYKYSPRHDRVLVDIARRVHDARFVFFSFEPVPALSRRLFARIDSAFVAAGLDSSKHILVLPWQPRAAFYSLMRQADAYLDTIGFSGFNTAMQAIECGLPIVTREGKFMRGRFGSAILKQLGMSDLVAADDEAYADHAARLALDRGHNQAVRRRIFAARHILFEDTRPIRALEDFLSEATASAANDQMRR